MKIPVSTSSVPSVPFTMAVTEPNPDSAYYIQSNEIELTESISEKESITEHIPDEQLFCQYVKAWRHERLFLSSITEIEKCPAHQDIVDMGDRALPFIFEELTRPQAKPDFWFLTLQKITGCNPVPKECEGNLRQICNSWIRWLKKQSNE